MGERSANTDATVLALIGERMGELPASAQWCLVRVDVAFGDAVSLSPSPARAKNVRWRQLVARALAIAALFALCLSGSMTSFARPQLASSMRDSHHRTVASIPAGSFESVLPPSERTTRMEVTPFQLDTTPVTNAQFAAFVARYPEWQRDRVPRVFADEQYLQHWTSLTKPASDDLNKPVLHVSWFAASAYCEARNARLPTWHEWEYVAAASESNRDARSDPAWRQQILSWYSQSGRKPPPAVGTQPANIYGVRDLHGVVWEWIEDLPALLVANDSREQGDPSQLRFCGAGAVSMEQKENYAMLMRIAMLSSMKASYTSATMGFRCAADTGNAR
jgi:formylglycine-generating enzyme required for sulfatase activity